MRSGDIGTKCIKTMQQQCCSTSYLKEEMEDVGDTVSATELVGARNGDIGLPGRLSGARRGPVRRRTLPALPPATGPAAPVLCPTDEPLCNDPLRAAAAAPPPICACRHIATLVHNGGSLQQQVRPLKHVCEGTRGRDLEAADHMLHLWKMCLGTRCGGKIVGEVHQVEDRALAQGALRAQVPLWQQKGAQHRLHRFLHYCIGDNISQAAP